jgi:hypothetical protein
MAVPNNPSFPHWVETPNAWGAWGWAAPINSDYAPNNNFRDHYEAWLAAGFPQAQTDKLKFAYTSCWPGTVAGPKEGSPTYHAPPLSVTRARDIVAGVRGPAAPAKGSTEPQAAPDTTTYIFVGAGAALILVYLMYGRA